MRWQQRASGHSYLSVMVIWIDVHPTGEEPDQHDIRAAPWVSHIRQPSAKSLLSQTRVSAHGMKSWLPAIIWSNHHPGLPHSPSNKPHRSREWRIDKVDTKLLRLPNPIIPDMLSVQLKLVHWGQNDMVLNRHRRGPATHPSLPSAPLSPICPARSYQQTWI
jgi:hypothetical protein